MNEEGVIERVEPRHGCLTRASRKREHVLVANVDQLVIVMSLVEPALKPHLIDRYLASAEQGGISPILCLNKADLVNPAEYQPLVGFYSQLGVPTFLTARNGLGIDRLRKLLKDRQTVFSGPERRRQILAPQCCPARAGVACPCRQRGHGERQTHHDHCLTPASGIRRLGRGHPRHSPVRALGHHSRRSGRLFPRVPALRPSLRLPRLHAHARRQLRRQKRRRLRTSARPGISATWACTQGRWKNGWRRNERSF